MLDFGVAKHVAADQRRVTSTGALVGTPRYMSPEQALSARDVDLQADLWSVAVVAYECLTGAAPFDGDTVGAVFVSIASGLFERPSRRAPGLPSDLDDWFERAFARDAHTRFASARELADSFATACEARTAAFPSRAPRAPVPARKSSAPPRPARVERAPGPALAPAPRLPRPESFAPAVVAPTLPTTSLPSPVSGTDSRTEAPTLTTATVTWSSARARGLLIAVAAGGFAATLLVAVAIGSKSFSGDATSSAEPPGAGSARVDASLERPLSTSPGWEDAKPDESVLSVDAFPPIVIEAGPPDAGDATKAKDAAKPPRPPDVVVPPPPPPPPKEPRTTPPPKPTVPPDCCDPWCIKRPPCN
jgi:serine/threonine-protein kinase